MFLVREYERLHVFRLGKLVAVKEPGYCFFLPILYQTVRTDLRLRSGLVYNQHVMSKDNLSLEMSVLFFYQVNNTANCWGNPLGWVIPAVQAALFTAAGESDFQAIVCDPQSFNRRLSELVKERTTGWSVTVSDCAVSNMNIKSEMIHALAKTAMAEREKRAKIIQAEGDCQSAPMLAEAARIMSSAPGAMTLRQLATMTLIAKEQESALVFPFVCELADPALRKEQDQ